MTQGKDFLTNFFFKLLQYNNFNSSQFLYLNTHEYLSRLLQNIVEVSCCYYAIIYILSQ